MVRIPMPSIVPKATYGILGFTVAVYLLQLLSVAVAGYAVYQIDWLELYGARINDALRAVILEGASLTSQVYRLAVIAAWGGISYVCTLRWFRWN